MSNSLTSGVSATAHDSIQRTMSGLKDGVASATAGLEQSQASVRDGMQKVMTTAHEMFAFSQGNFEAMAKSSQIFATGMQDIAQTMAAAAKASMDDAVSTFKAMSSVKSVKEAVDLQSSLVRTALERAVSQTSQITDSTMKLSEQAVAPISARMSLAAETFGKIG